MPTGSELRAEVLEEAKKCVCQDRQNTYGDAEDNFADIAKVWSVLLSDKLRTDFDALDVAQMSAAVKLCRLKGNKLHRDSWVDTAGYSACGGGIAKRIAEELASAVIAMEARMADVAARDKYPRPFTATGEVSIGDAQADFGSL